MGSGEKMRYFAWVRQFTGTPRVFRAYIRDRETGRPVDGCPHKHRRERAATKCADRMLRSHLVSIPTTGDHRSDG